MPNTTLNLSIPAELKEKALEQARERHFSSTSDYLQHLIQTDVELAEQKKKLGDFLPCHRRSETVVRVAE